MPTHVLHLDPEQAEILRVALEAGHGFLAARAARIDPDGAIQNSIIMSQRKTRHLLEQLKRPPRPEWGDLDAHTQRMAVGLAAQLVADGEPEVLASAWAALQGIGHNRAGQEAHLTGAGPEQ